MAYTLKSKTTGSWNGDSGQTVRETIVGEFQAAANAINTVEGKVPTKLAGKISEDKTTVTIGFYDPDATDHIKNGTEYTFSTVTESTYTDRVTITSHENIIKHGNNAQIGYTYLIQDGSEYISGYSATLLISVNGTRIPNKTTTKSRATGPVTGTLTIDSEYLREGTNTISIQYYTSLGSGGQTSGGFCPAIEIYSTNLVVSCETAKTFFASPKTFTENLPLSFGIKNSQGISINSITIDGETYQPKLRVYVESMYSNNLALSNQSTSISTSLNALITACSAYSDANVIKTGSGQIKIIVQAYVKNTAGEDIVTSTPIVLSLINSDCTVDGLYLSGVFYPTSVDQDGTFKWNVSQYNTFAFAENTTSSKIDLLVYLYSKTATSAVIKIGGTELTKELSANTCSQFIYDYLCRASGQLTFRIYKSSTSDYKLDSILGVTALTSGFKELTDQVINYNCESIVVNDSSTVDDLKVQTWNNNGYLAKFENFDWAVSKWAKVNGECCLQLSGDAKVTIPYKIYNISSTANGYAVSFRYSMSKSNDSNPVISCLDGDKGFSLTPGHIFFNNGSVVRLDIDDTDVHEVTFVVYANIADNGVWKNSEVVYIDGKLQLIAQCGTIPSNNKEITIQSQDAVLRLYNVNIFNRALSFMEAESLYCFNSKKGTALSNYINNNATVITANNSTNIYNQTSGSDNGTYGQTITPSSIPDGASYLVLTSYTKYDEVSKVYVSPDPDPWLTINSYLKDAEEKNKGRTHLLGSIQYYEKNGNTARNFYAVDGALSAQGTSSMGYALKNFRIYFGKKPKNVDYASSYQKQTSALYLGIPEGFVPGGSDDANYTKLTSDIGYSLFSSSYSTASPDADYSVPSAKANTFCLKADYAESSGSHNTAFARLSNKAMKDCEVVTNDTINPNETEKGIPQQQLCSSYGYDVRTNIDGRPVYLFFYRPECYLENTDYTNDANKLSAKYYYAGRYNMNNDKSNEKVFGFCDVTDYFNNDIVKAEGLALQGLAQTIDPSYDETHSSYSVGGTDYINPTECWEFSTNEGDAGEIGAFVFDKSKAFTERDTTTSDPDFSEYKVLKWMLAWEYRYPDLKGNGNGAYRRGTSKPYLLSKVYDFLYDNAYYLDQSISKLNSFARNIHLYFNVNSLLKYYVLTNWFGARDQRVKNMMLGFYCDPNNVSAAEAAESPLHYMRGYFIFYDNDTILGLNNDGYLDSNSDGTVGTPWSFEEGNSPMAHDGQTALWTNISTCHQMYLNGEQPTTLAYQLGQMVSEIYNNLRDEITNQSFNAYFNTQHVEYYPDTIQNIDTEIKYLYPEQLRLSSYGADGRTGDYGEISYNKDTGTRRLYRDQWFQNRSIWLDNLNKHTNDQSYNISFKGLYTPASAQAKPLTSITFKASDKFPKWRIYSYSGDAGTFTHDARSWKDTTLNINETYSQNTDSHIGGMYAIEELTIPEIQISAEGGFKIENPLPYLKKFEISSGIGASFPSVLASSAPNLESLSIKNFSKNDSTSFSSYNLSSFTKLKNIDFTGTKISSVTLCPSAESVKLDSPESLNITGLNALQVFTVANPTSLSSLTISNSSSTSYDTALACASQMATSGNKVTIDINFNGSEVYGFNGQSTTYMAYLNNIALAAQNNTVGSTITVKGTVYIDNASGFSTDVIESVFGDNLNIQRNDSTEPTLEGKDTSDENIYEGQYTHDTTKAIYETEEVIQDAGESESVLNECQIFTANRDITKWSITIASQPSNTLDGKVSIVKSTKRKCWIHVNPNNENTSENYGVTVTATPASGDSLTKSISIVYSKISNITLTTANVYTKNSISVKIGFNKNTKKYLLDSDHLTVSSGTIDYSDLTDVKFNTGAITQDTDFTVTFGTSATDRVSATIRIYYNSNIGQDADGADQSLADLSNKTNSKYWISLIPSVAGLNFGSYINKAQAHNITLTAKNIETIVSTLNSDQAFVQDFSDLQYFNATSEFTLPKYAFSDLVTPQGCSKVIMTHFDNDNSNSYKTITFTPNVNQIQVGITFTGSLPTNLKFDMSQTSITEIGYFGSTSTNQASFSLTYNSDSTVAKRETAIFVYPSGLTRLGNFGTISGDTVVFPTQCIFNIATSSASTSITGNLAQNALFNLNGIESNITLGLIASYLVLDSPFTDFTKFKTVAWAFPRNSGLLLSNASSGNYVDLTKVNVIGDCTFSRLNSSYSVCQGNTGANSTYTYLVFGSTSDETTHSSVTSIGQEAFYYGNYILRDNTTQEGVHFDNVTSIGAGAFYGMPNNQKIYLGNAQTNGSRISYIGSLAFGVLDESTIMEIHFTQTAAINTISSDAFNYSSGSSQNIGTINVYAPAGSELFALLQGYNGFTLYSE